MLHRFLLVPCSNCILCDSVRNDPSSAAVDVSNKSDNSLRAKGEQDLPNLRSPDDAGPDVALSASKESELDKQSLPGLEEGGFFATSQVTEFSDGTTSDALISGEAEVGLCVIASGLALRRCE